MKYEESEAQQGLRIAFAGTAELATTILNTLLEQSTHHINIVLTRPDMPAGRGRKLTSNAVKNLALKKKLNILQPSKSEMIHIRDNIAQTDLMIVIAYGVLLPEFILNAPAYGCINIHTSLLPKWRGAAPIQRTIQAGEHETGITVIQMNSILDAGSILLQKKCAISSTETSGSLHDKLAELASQCLPELLEKLLSEQHFTAVPQDEQQASYARKITKAEARIDWTQSAQNIDRMIRAFNPDPVCYTKLSGTTLRIWQAKVIDHELTSEPGSILSCNNTGIDIATGKGIIRILKLQPQGRRIMSTLDFLNGNSTFRNHWQKRI